MTPKDRTLAKIAKEFEARMAQREIHRALHAELMDDLFDVLAPHTNNLDEVIRATKKGA